jgi:enolase-phosphatase E1
VLLDIEGTTTPIDFVYDTLFPFARKKLKTFVENHFASDAVTSALELLKTDHRSETETDAPEWSDTPEAASRYALWLMDLDRKATGLKALQGLIWKEGYNTGELKATLYKDVAPAILRWIEAGIQVCIYSSGSVLAQKLLFAHTVMGDLTPLLSGYFDTTTGPKREANSYLKISETLGTNPSEIFFLSDMVAELDAAKIAGLPTGLVVRGIPPENLNGHLVYRDFQNL